MNSVLVERGGQEVVDPTENTGGFEVALLFIAQRFVRRDSDLHDLVTNFKDRQTSGFAFSHAG